jgi:ribonuclease Z
MNRELNKVSSVNNDKHETDVSRRHSFLAASNQSRPSVSWRFRSSSRVTCSSADREIQNMTSRSRDAAMSQTWPVPTASNSEWLCAGGVLSWKFPATIGSYTLIGRSRAADATSFYIAELDTLLDCGCLVTGSRPSHVFITHCHSDHCIDINRVLSRSRPPQIFVPQSMIEHVRGFIQQSERLKSAGRVNLDGNNALPNCQLIGVQSDEQLSFRKTMKVRVFDMDHSVNCYGYGFYECRQKLRKQYENLTSKEIADLRRTDKTLQITEERTIPLFVFMGDTARTVFDRYATALFDFPVIIVECSFIDNEQHAERAADVKHLVWVRPDAMLALDCLSNGICRHFRVTCSHWSCNTRTSPSCSFISRSNTTANK